MTKRIPYVLSMVMMLPTGCASGPSVAEPSTAVTTPLHTTGVAAGTTLVDYEQPVTPEMAHPLCG